MNRLEFPGCRMTDSFIRRYLSYGNHDVLRNLFQDKMIGK